MEFELRSNWAVKILVADKLLCESCVLEEPDVVVLLLGFGLKGAASEVPGRGIGVSGR